MQVEIEYCVPCGHLNRAIDTQRELLDTYGQDLEAVSLKTGDGGVFKVRIDDELVMDAQEDGYDLQTIHNEIKERLDA
ncbi:MAG: Rdx family protein [Nitriliruptorales bacterium]|nr:Rdx family protein [Nitriliruptorales bacterium]